MFNKIKEFFANFFEAQPYYSSDLEDFICSMNPQTVYDVEKLTNQFDNRFSKGI